jgi:hypothetical protein
MWPTPGARSMVAHGRDGWARRAAKIYVLSDLVIGPILVGAGLLAWAIFILGVASSWHYGVPWPIAISAVGVAWAAIAIGCRRVVRWGVALMRAPTAIPSVGVVVGCASRPKDSRTSPTRP